MIDPVQAEADQQQDRQAQARGGQAQGMHFRQHPLLGDRQPQRPGCAGLAQHHRHVQLRHRRAQRGIVPGMLPGLARADGRHRVRRNVLGRLAHLRQVDVAQVLALGGQQAGPAGVEGLDRSKPASGKPGRGTAMHSWRKNHSA